MNWHVQLEESIDYIEARLKAPLTDELDIAQLGKITRTSAYHYQRVFSFMVGVPLAEYIRRRKMTLAGADLQNGQRVTDVALKYGYSSPNSFTACFKRVHGVTPRQAQTQGCTLKSYPRIRFQITTTGDTEMNYRIENKPAFRVVGTGIDLPSQDIEKNFEVVPEFWGRSFADGSVGRLMSLMDGEPKGAMGITTGFGKAAGAAGVAGAGAAAGVEAAVGAADKAAESDLRYYIAVASNQPVPAGFEEYEVPAHTWAIFPGSGVVDDTTNALFELEKRIFSVCNCLVDRHHFRSMPTSPLPL